MGQTLIRTTDEKCKLKKREKEKSSQHSIKQFGLMRKLIWLLAMLLNT